MGKKEKKRKFRNATWQDLINPNVLDQFYLDIPELGLEKALAYHSGSCDIDNHTRKHLMSLYPQPRNELMERKGINPERIRSIQIICGLFEIFVEE